MSLVGGKARCLDVLYAARQYRPDISSAKQYAHRVSTWLAADDFSEFMSMEVSRRMMLKLMPKVGDKLHSNRRVPILTLTEDTSPGIHDTLFMCCDRYTYESMGCTEYHRNCADNLVEGLAELELTAPRIPNPR